MGHGPLPETPEMLLARKFKYQQATISGWINDPDHEATEECRHVLELYAQLNDSEFLYVTDLQLIYDEARCFFLQWILGKCERYEHEIDYRLWDIGSSKSL